LLIFDVRWGAPPFIGRKRRHAYYDAALAPHADALLISLYFSHEMPPPRRRRRAYQRCRQYFQPPDILLFAAAYDAAALRHAAISYCHYAIAADISLSCLFRHDIIYARGSFIAAAPINSHYLPGFPSTVNCSRNFVFVCFVAGGRMRRHYAPHDATPCDAIYALPLLPPLKNIYYAPYGAAAPHNAMVAPLAARDAEANIYVIVDDASST